jgi:hypothetical protein
MNLTNIGHRVRIYVDMSVYYSPRSSLRDSVVNSVWNSVRDSVWNSVWFYISISIQEQYEYN